MCLYLAPTERDAQVATRCGPNVSCGSLVVIGRLRSENRYRVSRLERTTECDLA